jgi:carbamoyl-phosphate synthase small subunit
MRPEQQQVLMDWARAVGLTQMHGRKAIYERFCELVGPLGHKVPSLPAIDKWIERGVIPWRWQVVLTDLRRQSEGEGPPATVRPEATDPADSSFPATPALPTASEPQTRRIPPMSSTMSETPASALASLTVDAPLTVDALTPISGDTPLHTALLVLADGTVMKGRGLGAIGSAVGEVCFNTSMTGYQEIMTDPSYAGQIINFTFPHIGNVGSNGEDIETLTPAARGCVLSADITQPSNWRSAQHFDPWLKRHNLPGIAGIDTRKLTRRIRDGGAPNGVIIHDPEGRFDIAALVAEAKAWPGLDGMDLAKDVTCRQTYSWDETTWSLGLGYGKQTSPKHRIVAVDYGAKRNILRCLAATGCAVTVVPATATTADILRHRPDGVFLSNGPGDPAATGAYAVPVIRDLIGQGLPVFGICLGHQMLALALGGKTEKMARGHRGANHPVKDLTTGKVEITSQNHGFQVMPESLPNTVRITHQSLFDGSVEGLELSGKPVFSVQYHPEASPGPEDSHYLFDRFIEKIDQHKAGA